MRYVLDASVAVSSVVSRPLTSKALRLRQDYQRGIHKLLAPSIFSAETASALTKCERQKIVPVGQALPLPSPFRPPPFPSPANHSPTSVPRHRERYASIASRCCLNAWYFFSGTRRDVLLRPRNQFLPLVRLHDASIAIDGRSNSRVSIPMSFYTITHPTT